MIGWWVWFALAPSGADTVLCRLYRYRYNGGYQVTQISDGFTINSATPYEIHDLSSLLRPAAEDFSEVVNEDHLAIAVLSTGTNSMRALNHRVQFGLPGSGASVKVTPPMDPPVWPAP